ncbi:MAG: pirin family protein [Ignavibacteria bacterium]|nr:pirin family protein [Ignavibacteria bacterium]
MKAVHYPASERGHANFGWLDSYHTFSFGQYYDPSRMNFGALRVFNDDAVAAGEGFGTHPHKNMEIISIPLEGVIMHQDSMGHKEGIAVGDVLVMSAGSGITHSEYNGSSTDALKFFQIWIIPNEANVEPRYDQATIGPIASNTITTVVGPKNTGLPLWIHQQAWLCFGHVAQGERLQYDRRGNDTGVFTFVIDGALRVTGADGEATLGMRDGIGVLDEPMLTYTSNATSQFIVIEVPLA